MRARARLSPAVCWVVFAVCWVAYHSIAGCNCDTPFTGSRCDLTCLPFVSLRFHSTVQDAIVAAKENVTALQRQVKSLKADETALEAKVCSQFVATCATHAPTFTVAL